MNRTHVDSGDSFHEKLISDWNTRPQRKKEVESAEEFLRNEHAKDYYGVKDDMPDAFVEWLTKLDVNDWVELMGKFSPQSKRELDKIMILRVIRNTELYFVKHLAITQEYRIDLEERLTEAIHQAYSKGELYEK